MVCAAKIGSPPIDRVNRRCYPGNGRKGLRIMRRAMVLLIGGALLSGVAAYAAMTRASAQGSTKAAVAAPRPAQG